MNPLFRAGRAEFRGRGLAAEDLLPLPGRQGKAHLLPRGRGRGAPTMLLLHGFPTTSHAYRELIALLSGRYHVIAPDYLGSGFSEKPDPGEVTYTFDLLAEYVNGLVAARGIDKYVLYMHDFGGPVGFRVMLSHGPRLRIPYRTNPGLRRLIGRPARPVATGRHGRSCGRRRVGDRLRRDRASRSIRPLEHPASRGVPHERRGRDRARGGSPCRHPEPAVGTSKCLFVSCHR